MNMFFSFTSVTFLKIEIKVEANINAGNQNNGQKQDQIK